MSSIAEKIHPQFIKDSQGNNSFVVLTADEYEELLEDLADLAIIAERRDEPTLSHEEFRTELEEDGLL